MGNFYESLILFLQENIPIFVENSQQIFLSLFTILFIFIILLWFYCPIFILVDSNNRIKNLWIRLVLFILGGVFGPFFLVIYLLIRPKITFEEEFFYLLEKRFFYNQASKVLICRNCQNYIGEDKLYCTFCGYQNRFNCSKCQSIVDYDDDYCGFCGVQLIHNINLVHNSQVNNDLHAKIKNIDEKRLNIALIYFNLGFKFKLFVKNIFVFLKNTLDKFSNFFKVKKTNNTSEKDSSDISLGQEDQKNLVKQNKLDKINNKKNKKKKKKKR